MSMQYSVPLRSRWLRALCQCACAALALAASGCDVSTPTARATPTPPSTVTPQGSATPPALTASLGPPPATCPPSPSLATMTLPPDFGGGFHGDFQVDGGAPVWKLGLGFGGNSTVHFNKGNEPYPSTKVMWIVGPSYSQPVTLEGRETQTGAPLWFEIYPGGNLAYSVFTTHAVLDPSSPNRGSAINSLGRWPIWGIGVIALTAGCYDLSASGSQRFWHTVVAIGS